MEKRERREKGEREREREREREKEKGEGFYHHPNRKSFEPSVCVFHSVTGSIYLRFLLTALSCYSFSLSLSFFLSLSQSLSLSPSLSFDKIYMRAQSFLFVPIIRISWSLKNSVRHCTERGAITHFFAIIYQREINRRKQFLQVKCYNRDPSLFICSHHRSYGNTETERPVFRNLRLNIINNCVQMMAIQKAALSLDSPCN